MDGFIPRIFWLGSEEAKKGTSHTQMSWREDPEMELILNLTSNSFKLVVYKAVVEETELTFVIL